MLHTSLNIKVLSCYNCTHHVKMQYVKLIRLYAIVKITILGSIGWEILDKQKWGGESNKCTNMVFLRGLIYNSGWVPA